ncbi:glutathione Stransferase [Seminavis robusta]|uniref:Glutathione Stransferase n=1 Tax=Seminavis robusta TaxID=568900 RepID=A0A9N8DBY8_9STRA|nr:glutathione Stransferase [Seminavis robusta]|eukprot:Sro82_g044110.1 glutathione Stransferase (235) ;mRNA; r:122642-123346
MSEDKVILWTLPPSSNSAVIRTFLLAAEIPFEEKNAWGQTRTPEYIAKFPNNCAPAVEHGDFSVCETAASMRYLAKAFPDKAGKFYPSDNAQKAAKIDMVCDMINTGICNLIPKAAYPTLGFPLYAGDVAAMDESKEHTKASQKAAADAIKEYLENKVVGILLDKTKFLMSDTPTIADFRFAPMLSQIKVTMELPDGIADYLERMEADVPGFADGNKPANEYNSKFWVTNPVDC